MSGGTFPEEHLMWRMLVSHEGLSGVAVKSLCADTRYGTSDNYRLLKVKNILPAIPLRKGGAKPTGYTKENFTYDKETDSFTCPRNKKLLPAKPVGFYLPYRSRKFDCNRCQVKSACIAEGDRKTVMVSKNHRIRLWARSQLALPFAKELLRRRKIWPETIFGTAKTQHGLRRAKYRGRWKVEIQLLMTAMAMNLKKLARYGGYTEGRAFEKINQLVKRLSDCFSGFLNLLQPVFE